MSQKCRAFDLASVLLRQVCLKAILKENKTFMIPILVADDVAAVLGSSDAALVRSGGAVTNPQVECMVCRELFDVRKEQAAAVALTAPEHVLVNLIHASCGPSATYPLSELEARFGRPDDPKEPGRSPVPDITYTTVVQLGDGKLYPAIAITPGNNISTFAPGAVTPVDSAIEELRGLGFDHVDLSGARRPVELERWAVRLERGALSQISKPGGSWWSSSNPPALDLRWRQAARATRTCLVMVVTTAIPENGGLAAMRAALVTASETGRLVGALVPVRGSMS